MSAIAHGVRERASLAARRAQPLIRRRWQSAVLRRGVDASSTCAGRSALVLAPHPDDETLGCGAAIARKRRAGTAVTIVVATDGRYSHRSRVITPSELARLRSAECVEAAGRLGVAADDVHQLGYEETTLAREIPHLSEQLAWFILSVQPDEVLVTSDLDWHVDHQALHEALRRACARLADPPPCLAYPIWYWASGPWRHDQPRRSTAAAWHLASEPVYAARALRPVLVATDVYLETKRAALAAYRTQLTNLTGEPEWATMDEAFLAQFLGDYEVYLPIEHLGGRR